MEAESMSVNGANGALVGVNGDIAHALDRKKHMLALIPMQGEVPRTFLLKLHREARSRRKKLIILSPRRDIEWISTVIRGAEEEEGNGSDVVSFSSRDLRCNMDGSDTDPGDLLNHCIRKDRMDLCPFQTGFDLDIYREIKLSGGTLISEMVEDIKDKGMCPARTAVDISTEARTIITDYPFVFSEGWDKLFEFMGHDPGETILAISDPPSLTEYLWERFRYSFHTADLYVDTWEFGPMKEGTKAGMEVLLEVMRDLTSNWDLAQPLERKNLIQDYRQRSALRNISLGIGDLMDKMKELLDHGEFETINGRKKVKDLYLFLKLWMKEHTSVARTVEEDRDGRSINLSLMDLQVMVRPILESFPTVILFGDTLYPQGLYTHLLGLSPEDTLNRSYITYEDMERTSVVSFGNVETSYKMRNENTWNGIVRNIMKVTSSTPGMVMAIFPSYFIQEAVMDELLQQEFDRSIIEERRGMTKDEKRRLMDEVKLGGDILVLTVQGGYLSRALDRGGIIPDTVMIVGMHIPPPTPRSGQLKVHMQKKHGTNLGHVISVLLPALTKVMKVINTMTNTPGEGKNLVILMDRRYQDSRVIESLPRFYNIKRLSGENDYHGERYFS